MLRLRMPALALALLPCLSLGCSVSLFGDPPSDGGADDARDGEAGEPDADADGEPDAETDTEPDAEEDGADTGGGCDVAENCAGVSPLCPADAYDAAGDVCRPAATGGCDVAELCTGSSATCPANSYRPSSHTCRPSGGDCDVTERCTGSSATCPADTLRPAGYVCRHSLQPCDYEELCTGSDDDCPSNILLPDGWPCTTLDPLPRGGTCCTGVCEGGWECCHDGNCRCGRPDIVQLCSELTTSTACGFWPGCVWDRGVDACVGISGCPYFRMSTACNTSSGGRCSWSTGLLACSPLHQCRWDGPPARGAVRRLLRRRLTRPASRLLLGVCTQQVRAGSGDGA